MIFSGDSVTRVHSIFLRPWQTSDAKDLCAAFCSTQDLSVQFGEAVLDSPESAAQFIESHLGSNSNSVLDLAIEAEGKAVGNVGIRNLDARHNTAWMYYWIRQEARGRGLPSREAASLGQWAIDELQIFRLELGHRVNNPASCRVAINAGFIPEGIERAKLRYGVERFDVETHARLATDPAPKLELIPVHAHG